MNKLELRVKSLQATLGIDDDKAKVISETIREHSAETVNMALYLKEKGLDMEIGRGIMEDSGIIYDGKTKKFK